MNTIEVVFIKQKKRCTRECRATLCTMPFLKHDQNMIGIVLTFQCAAKREDLHTNIHFNLICHTLIVDSIVDCCR